MQRRDRRALLAALAVTAVAGCAGNGPSPTQPGATATAPTPTAAVTPQPTRTPEVLPDGVTLAGGLDIRPSGILAYGDALWAEDHSRTNAFYAIDPETMEIVTTIDADRPCDLAAGFDKLWMVDLGAGTLFSVDPETHAVLETVADGLEYGCGPVTAGGAIWLAADPGFARVDPSTGEWKVTDTNGGTFPAAGTTPGGDAVWGALFESAELVRIDIETGEVELRIPPPGQVTDEQPAAVAFGSLWVGNGPMDRVFRLDPETGAKQDEIEAAHPTRFLVTEDALWLTSYPTGTVERIDPETNEVVFSAHLGGSLNGITEGFGSIWVADTGSGKLYLIDPDAAGRYE